VVVHRKEIKTMPIEAKAGWTVLGLLAIIVCGSFMIVACKDKPPVPAGIKQEFAVKGGKQVPIYVLPQGEQFISWNVHINQLIMQYGSLPAEYHTYELHNGQWRLTAIFKH
jgi:hypothetical protein